MPTSKDERAQRLAEALRANLRKRKEGQRLPDRADSRRDLGKAGD